MPRFLALFLACLALAIGGATAQTQVPRSQQEIAFGFAPLVREAAPAVVNIYAKVVRQSKDNSFSSDPFFTDFFSGLGVQRPSVQNSLGSGVILSPDGIVVSNYHVVGMATEIRVVLADRREYTADVLLADEESDLAILQMTEARNLPHLDLRDSDSVEVGELVLAIGNPFGVGQTVTGGIISGLARSGALTGNTRGYFLQTDAAINPGNSGGALVDVNGDLIGINTAILSQSGGSNGIGFAIPANLVAEFVTQARGGHSMFLRPWAGMAGEPVNPALAAQLEMPRPYGMVVTDMHSRSPFAISGLLVGDVITEVDGRDVNSPSEMIFRMSTVGIGKTVEIRYLRDGVLRHAPVNLIAPPQDPPADQKTLTDGTVLPGLTISRLNPALIVEWALPLQIDGALVVDPGQYGTRAGLRKGDVVLAINGVEVRSADEVAVELVNPGQNVQLDVIRQGKQYDIRFRI